jgi:hypothetical protein
MLREPSMEAAWVRAAERSAEMAQAAGWPVRHPVCAAVRCGGDRCGELSAGPVPAGWWRPAPAAGQPRERTGVRPARRHRRSGPERLRPESSAGRWMAGASAGTAPSACAAGSGISALWSYYEAWCQVRCSAGVMGSAGDVVASDSRMGQSGRSSPWQRSTSFRRVSRMPCNSAILASISLI